MPHYIGRMDGGIYDFGLKRSPFQMDELRRSPASDRPSRDETIRRVSAGRRDTGLVGLIANPRSHRNSGRTASWMEHPNVIGHAPRTRAELFDVLSRLAARSIDLLVIDGGDGTVRDILTCAGDLWGRSWPDILMLPTGKTNALARDLGVPSWGLAEGLAAAGNGRMVSRRPLEITSAEAPDRVIRGFIFGAGAFVDATALAQRTHRAGAYNGWAVGLALAWGIGQTLVGRDDSVWRAGSRMTLSYGARAERMHGAAPEGAADRYLLFASTLHRLPLGIKPFGAVRPGLKTLVIDAPPRRLLGTAGPLLMGSQSARLEQSGYHRVDSDQVDVDIASGFILDGETFAPGAYAIREGAPLNFVTA